jgi:hypothetical protein
VLKEPPDGLMGLSIEDQVTTNGAVPPDQTISQVARKLVVPHGVKVKVGPAAACAGEAGAIAAAANARMKPEATYVLREVLCMGEVSIS